MFVSSIKRWVSGRYRRNLEKYEDKRAKIAKIHHNLEKNPAYRTFRSKMLR